MKMLLATLTFLAAPAFAKDAPEAARYLREAQMSLGDAIRTAERIANGTAVKAEFDGHNGRTVFEIEVLSGATLYEVRLGSDGSILRVRED